VADFIGINNLIAGQVKQVDEAGRVMAVDTRFGLIQCLPDKQLREGDACEISVRPEVASIGVLTEARDGMNAICGTVSFASYIGNAIRYDIELDRQTIFRVDVQNPRNQEPFPMNEKVSVCFPIRVTLGIPVIRG
jgi:ABC-type Fe3+/spermidine/putrescine transport system ATPase subunit